MAYLTNKAILFTPSLGGSALSCPTEANDVDATKLVVCHNKRIKNHQVFKDFAQRGKSSIGWFYGFKLYAIINQYGQLVAPANVADNNAELPESLTKKITGFLFGDKGYLTKLKETFKERWLDLIPKLRDKIKPKIEDKITPKQAYYLNHRGLIETVFDLLKIGIVLSI